MATTDADKDKTPEGTKGFKVGELRTMIGELVAEAVKGVTTGGTKDDDSTTGRPEGTSGDRARSVGALVAEQVKKIQDAESAKQKQAEKDKTIQDKLDELSKATAEKPPVERRRVHKVMGWGEPPQ